MKHLYSLVIIISLIFISTSGVYAQNTSTFQVTSVSTDSDEADPGVTILEATPVEEETEGDPDRPLISPGAVNPSTVGIEYEDIDVTSNSGDDDEMDKVLQRNETNLDFVRERAEETLDEEYSGEIEFLSPSLKATKGSIEYSWKVEEGQKSIPEGDDGNNVAVMPETSQMNKSDLVESIATKSDGGLRAGFVKLGDIKGEADDSALSKKPREIVVVGSKVRDEAVPHVVLPEDDPESGFNVFFDVSVDINDEDLGLYAVGLAQRDENIRGILITDEEVSLAYRSEVRLFGIIPIQASLRAVVTFMDGELGRVKVKMPWWHVFGRKEVTPQDLETELQKELDKLEVGETTGEDRPTETISLNFAKFQAQTLQIISNVSKATHDIAMSSIRNLK